jgi:hypothetical protein
MNENDESDSIDDILDDIRAPPEAMEAYPDECANCGAPACSFWVPNDYHKLSDSEQDAGICTECGHDFAGE